MSPVEDGRRACSVDLFVQFGREQQAFLFDDRPLLEQIREVCLSFGVDCGDGFEPYVLTRGLGPEAPPVTGPLELLALPPKVCLGLHRGGDAVAAHLSVLARVPAGQAAEALASFFAAVHGLTWFAAEAIEQDGIGTLIGIAATYSMARGFEAEIDLLMACLCVILGACEQAASEWFGYRQELLGPQLFSAAFSVLFPAETEEPREAQATLAVCLFFLRTLPGCASAAAAAARTCGASDKIEDATWEGTVYNRILIAMYQGADEVDVPVTDFQKSAAAAFMCALAGAVEHQDQVRVQIRNDLTKCGMERDEVDALFQRIYGDAHLIEMLLHTSRAAAVQLAVKNSRESSHHEETDRLRQEMSQMRDEVQLLQKSLAEKTDAMRVMVPFMRVDSSLIVEESLDALIHLGWDSIQWKGNFTLLHFAADCIEDPLVIELTAAFCNDLDQFDDAGMRPIDYARRNVCPEVTATLEALRRKRDDARGIVRKQSARGEPECDSRAIPFDENIVSSQIEAMGRISTTAQEIDVTASQATVDEQLDPRVVGLLGLTPELRSGIDAVLKLGGEGIAWPRGFTALHMAASLGHSEAVELLVEAQADVTARDDQKRSPLDYAKDGGFDAIQSQLQRCIATQKQQQMVRRQQKEEKWRAILAGATASATQADDYETAFGRRASRRKRTRLKTQERLERWNAMEAALPEAGVVEDTTEPMHHALTQSSVGVQEEAGSDSEFGLSAMQLTRRFSRRGSATAPSFGKRASVAGNVEFAIGSGDESASGGSSSSDFGLSSQKINGLMQRYGSMKETSRRDVVVHRMSVSMQGGIIQRDDSDRADSDYGLSDRQVFALTRGSEDSHEDDDQALSDPEVGKFGGAPSFRMDSMQSMGRRQSFGMGNEHTDQSEESFGLSGRQLAGMQTRRRFSSNRRLSIKPTGTGVDGNYIMDTDSRLGTTPHLGFEHPSPDGMGPAHRRLTLTLRRDSHASSHASSADSEYGISTRQLEMLHSRHRKEFDRRISPGSIAESSDIFGTQSIESNGQPDTTNTLSEAASATSSSAPPSPRAQDPTSYASSSRGPLDKSRQAVTKRRSVSFAEEEVSGLVKPSPARLTASKASGVPARSAGAGASGSERREGSPGAPSDVERNDANIDENSAHRFERLAFGGIIGGGNEETPAQPRRPEDVRESAGSDDKSTVSGNSGGAGALGGGSPGGREGPYTREGAREGEVAAKEAPVSARGAVGVGSDAAVDGSEAAAAPQRVPRAQRLVKSTTIAASALAPGVTGLVLDARGERRRPRMRMQTEIRGPQVDVPEELHLSIEAAKMQMEKKVAHVGHAIQLSDLADAKLESFLSQVQAYGSDAVASKLQEPAAVGGLSLGAEAARRLAGQLAVVMRLAAGARLLEAPTLAASRARRQSMSSEEPIAIGDEDEKPGTKGDNEQAAEAKAEGKAEGKGPSKASEAKGKEKGKKGAPKGPPKGEGKGSDAKGKSSKGLELRRKPVKPSVPLKTLWWTRLLLGKESEKNQSQTIWDTIVEDEEILPARQLEERYSKRVDMNKAKNTGKISEKAAAEVKVIRIITKLGLLAGMEAAIKKLPPLADIEAAITALDDTVLSPEAVEIVRLNFCATPEQKAELEQARKLHGVHVPMAQPEQYMWVISHIPAYQARVECWFFASTYREEVLFLTERLEQTERCFDSLRQCKALPAFLALILSVGNYLNGGHALLGQADGFELEKTFEALEAVKDPQNKDLRHIIFDVWFNRCSRAAASMLEDLTPLWEAVGRKVSSDKDGVEFLQKQVHVSVEDLDASTSALKKECDTRAESMELAIHMCADPADPFRLRMPEKIKGAQESIDGLCTLRDRVKDNYVGLVAWFKASATKSSTFVKLWDDLFVPAQLFSRHSGPIKKNVLIPALCSQKAPSMDALMTLWSIPNRRIEHMRTSDMERLKNRRGSVLGSARRATPMRSELTSIGPTLTKLAERRASVAGRRASMGMVTAAFSAEEHQEKAIGAAEAQLGRTETESLLVFHALPSVRPRTRTRSASSYAQGSLQELSGAATQEKNTALRSLMKRMRSARPF